MKVLFAVHEEKVSSSIVKKYQKEYKEIISYKNVYYFNAILKELQRDKSYDRIVIDEGLEEYTSTSYQQQDKFIFDMLDNVTDEASNINGKEIPIILICSERRRKSEEIFVKLFGIGIYNAIIGNDRSTDEVCRLINQPRTKKVAKIYYKIDSDDVNYKPENENDVSEEEVQHILSYFKSIGKNEEKCVKGFKNLVSQYNEDQLKVIVAILPLSVKSILEESSPEYQKMVSKRTRKTGYVPNKIVTTSRPSGTSGKLLNVQEGRKNNTKPIVIPSSMNNNTIVKKISIKKPSIVQDYEDDYEDDFEDDFVEEINDNVGKVDKVGIVDKFEELETVKEIVNEEKEVVNEQEVIVQQPRKRGRPPKKKTPEEIEEEMRPKRRGRPPKKKEISGQEKFDDFDDDEKNKASSVLPGLGEINEYEDDDDDFELPGLNNTEETELPGFEDLDEDDDDLDLPELDDLEEEEDDFELPGFDDIEDEEDDAELPGLDDIDEDEEDFELPGFDDIEDDEEDVELPGFQDEDEEDEKQQEDLELPGLDDDEDNDSTLSRFEYVDDEDDEDDYSKFDIAKSIEKFETKNDDENDYKIDSNNYNYANEEYEDILLKKKENNNQFESNTNTNKNVMRKDIQKYDSNYDYSTYNSLLSSDKKVVAFVGTSKNGTSFIVNNIAQVLADSGINTAILDATKNKNSYYIYTKNDENLRKIASESVENLVNGNSMPINVKNNLSVYTEVPNQQDNIQNVGPILETLVENHSAVLIDCDFDTPLDYFANVQEIYLVQSMDILTIQPFTAFLRDLKAKDILNDDKLKIIANKVLKMKTISTRNVVGGMAYYNDPEMSFMTELFDRNKVQFVEIPFDLDAYTKYLDQIVDCEISPSRYTKEFQAVLKKVASIIYPVLPSTNSNVKGKKGYQYGVNYSNGFSNSVNNTLNNMKKKY